MKKEIRRRVIALSKYTTELRYICETLAGKQDSEGYDSVDSIINTALPLLFNFDFPIFDENYRTVLEKKIVMHYYRREICAETVGLWKLYLQTKLNEIMPYYNQLYRTELIEFNPLYDVNLKKSYTKANEGTGSGQDSSTNTLSGSKNIIQNTTDTAQNTYEKDITDNSTTTKDSTIGVEDEYSGSKQNSIATENTTTLLDDHVRAFSDTPNNKLNNVRDMDYLTDLTRETADDTHHDLGTNNESGNYSDTKSGETTEDTDITENRTIDQTDTESRNRVIGNTSSEADTVTNNGSSSYSNSINNTENYIENVEGSSGGASYSKRIAEFRKNILNIDMMIINDLNSLFFGLW